VIVGRLAEVAHEMIWLYYSIILKQMKVVHVMNKLCPSGAEVMLKLAAPVWSDRGVELCILSCGEVEGAYADVLRSAGYRIYSCPRRRGITSMVWFYRLIRTFEEIQPDVAHIHCEAQGLLIALAARLGGVGEIIRTVHSIFQFDGFLRARKSIERGLMRAIGTRNVSIGESVRVNEMRRFRNQTTLIDNWIDVAHFRPPSLEERRSAREELRVNESQQLIVSVGNGCDIKNYQTIIKTIHAIDRSNLIYFQVGNEHDAGTDRRLVDELNLGDKVKFTGSVTNVRTYLWAADVYLMPSLIEGFGLAAAEALATGLPCIFSRVPGLKDWEMKGLEIIWANTPEAASVEKALLDFITMNLSDCNNPYAGNVQIIQRTSSVERGADAYLELYLGAAG